MAIVHRLGRLAVTAMLIAACTSTTPAAPAPAVAVTAPGTPVPAGATSGAAAQVAAFMTIPLTDARTGERFTVADFKGKVTIVEGMAVW